MSFVGRLLEPKATARIDAGGGVVIEPMRRRHIKDLMEIEVQVYPKPWTSGVFHTELEQMRDGYRNYVVAKVGGTLVGYAGLLFSGEDAHVTNIAVDPSRQRSHIGTRLLLHQAHYARDKGFKNLTLEVRVSNTAAQELYRRFGFAPAGVRRKYYEDVEDAIVMWCHDVDSHEFKVRLESLGVGLDR